MALTLSSRKSRRCSRLETKMEPAERKVESGKCGREEQEEQYPVNLFPDEILY
jgi:hypothetical protein